MASCPNCGFDLNTEGVCTVCGFMTSQEGKGEPVQLRGRTHESPAPVVDPEPLVDHEALVDIDARSEARSATANAGLALGERKRSSLTPIVIGVVVLLALAGVGAVVLHQQGGAAQGSAPKVANHVQPQKSASASRTASKGGSGSPTGTAASRPAATGGAQAKASTDSPASTAARPATKISRVGYSAPVGASPESIRATHPVDLYNPPREPMYNIAKRTAFPPLTSEGAYVKWMLAHTHQQEKYLRERWVRASIAVAHHLIIHRSVLTAFLLTPREWFVRSYNLPKTYENSALPIGYGQTISGPDLVAHMTDALDPKPNQKILEIGTGSGYQSALLSQLSNYVYTIEIVRPLAEQTNQIYLDHTKQMPEYANIHRRLADGYYGWPKFAPFDRIIVTTGIDHIPPDLLKQLKPGGIMVIPIGPPSGQTILKITKTVDKNGRVHLTRKDIYHGIKDIFVPFTASGGGTHDTGGSQKR